MAYLGNPKNTIEVLQKYNFNFQKKFGQNFLIDTGILEEIIDSAGITKDDMIPVSYTHLDVYKRQVQEHADT